MYLIIIILHFVKRLFSTPKPKLKPKPNRTERTGTCNKQSIQILCLCLTRIPHTHVPQSYCTSLSPLPAVPCLYKQHTHTDTHTYTHTHTQYSQQHTVNHRYYFSIIFKIGSAMKCVLSIDCCSV